MTHIKTNITSIWQIKKLLNIVSVLFPSSQENLSTHRELSASSDSLSENSNKVSLPVITDTDTQQTYSRPWSLRTNPPWLITCLIPVCVCFRTKEEYSAGCSRKLQSLQTLLRLTRWWRRFKKDESDQFLYPLISLILQPRRHTEVFWLCVSGPAISARRSVRQLR